MVMLIFSVLDQKCRFGGNLVQKIKIVILSWNFILKFVFFKLKFCNQTNMNMQNSMVMLIFFCFRSEIACSGKFGPKNKNYYFELKFGANTNLNMQNLMVMQTFFILDWKYPFLVNLVQKFKIVTLCWSLVLRLIWICMIQWWCWFFLL